MSAPGNRFDVRLLTSALVRAKVGKQFQGHQWVANDDVTDLRGTDTVDLLSQVLDAGGRPAQYGDIDSREIVDPCLQSAEWFVDH